MIEMLLLSEFFLIIGCQKSDLNTLLSFHAPHRNMLLVQTSSARAQHSGTLSGNSGVDLEAQRIFPCSAFPQQA